MPSTQLIEFLLHSILFVLGANIGSFLNVVIYRLPLGISLSNPKRSFCPHCKTQIPIYRNIPLFTWLFQRGKCAACKAPIPFRYFFVELLTAVLFYLIFLKFRGHWDDITGWGDLVLIYWIFTALLIAGTFIDIDYFILPHEITLGGLAVGLLGSYLIPEMMGEVERGRAILLSFVSACIGLGLLWTVVELGKLAFGRLKQKFDQPESWTIHQPDETQPPIFKIAGDELSWADIYTRPSDRLIITGPAITINDETFTTANAKAEITVDKIKLHLSSGESKTFSLETVTKLEGKATDIVIPREAMGFGDVLLIAMIGSFLGWQAVFFTIVAASFLGSLLAILPRLIGKTEWTAKIPFGPYLAGGAMIWLFSGPQLVDWYLTKTGFRDW
ncbi:prepilin peptidase [Phragmitibacter flavus]|uniref:Prepilin peptidase n=1 Tax=Phragmitibacter flavus TaxID=2576071 RepID=A0A5R8KDW2_9BACT|nr:A24 family peptidase [Phragmitibacter flavus]TLD70481.1 prepilin peptidase [Phragmitibacter flavus]